MFAAFRRRRPQLEDVAAVLLALVYLGSFVVVLQLALAKLVYRGAF